MRSEVRRPPAALLRIGDDQHRRDVAAMETVDARAARFDHGVLALALFGGFVFEFVPVIPAGGVLMALSSLRPEISAAPWVFARLVAPRLASSPPREDAAPWRAAARLAAFLLGLGTLTLAIGDRGIAWVFALAVAALGALTSAGGICVGCQLHARRHGHEPYGDGRHER